MYSKDDVMNLFEEIKNNNLNISVFDVDRYFSKHFSQLDALWKKGDFGSSLKYCDNGENGINIWDIFFHFVFVKHNGQTLYELFTRKDDSCIISLENPYWKTIEGELNNLYVLIAGNQPVESGLYDLATAGKSEFDLCTLALLYSTKYEHVLLASWTNGEPLINKKESGENIYGSLHEALGHYLMDEFYLFLQTMYDFVKNN